MKSKTILSADEMLEILNSQWATVQDIMKIGRIRQTAAVRSAEGCSVFSRCASAARNRQRPARFPQERTAPRYAALRRRNRWKTHIRAR